ncbi:MAG: sigma 54-interacting transcriptional regulator, partial [Planctomycetota bacterium]|jgi:transcriptional regulator with GAF, ATPase, and Fis domain
MLSSIIDMLLEITGSERGLLLLQREHGPLDEATGERYRDQKLAIDMGKQGGYLHLSVGLCQDAKKRMIAAEDWSEAAVRKCATTRLPVFILGYTGEDDPEVDSEVRELGLKLVLSVPLMVGSRLVGVLYCDSRTSTREVGEADLIFFQALARETGAAIEKARLYEENVRARREVEALNERLAEKVETQAHELEETRERLEVVEVELKTKYDYGKIVGKSEPMQRVYRLLDRVTDTDVPVLIHGESGTGKELVAKAIHYNGPRKKKRFVTVNCAAIAPTLLESELFGHVRGAFTGADRDKAGLFEQADGGTLFLDEVQDMPQSMQRELLRALQEKEVRRVGGKDVTKVDVRVIAATNRNLRDLMHEGSFREDLYYRLNVVTINLPPLRERIEDIPLLVDRHLQSLCESQGRPGVKVTRRATRKLCRGRYSGNVRELHNILERALLMLDADILDEGDFEIDLLAPEEIEAAAGRAAAPGSGPAAPVSATAAAAAGLFLLPYKEASEAFKATYVQNLLERNHGNVTRASQESGLVRSSLHKIMRKLDVDAKTIRDRLRS